MRHCSSAFSVETGFPPGASAERVAMYRFAPVVLSELGRLLFLGMWGRILITGG